MKITFFTVFLIALMGLCNTGCKPNHAPPPLEKGKLVMRFFSSIEKGDYAAAARQGEKLSSMDKHNSSIVELIEIQQCNIYVKKAQEELDNGNLNDAMEIIQEGIESYPGNRTLPAYYSKLRQLRNAKRLINNMEKAKSSSAKTSALAAAVTGLSRNQTKELDTYFNNYRKNITVNKKTAVSKNPKTNTITKNATKAAKSNDIKNKDAKKKVVANKKLDKTNPKITTKTAAPKENLKK